MQYLTPAELAKQAPATQRLRPKDPGLLDTAAFLRHIEREKGFLPVLAIQGTPHEDALYGPKKGRHLVVAADRRGNALILLNSHTGRRKTWMGTGFVAIREDRPLFVVGAAIPIARWRGFEEPLAELAKWDPALRGVKKALEAYSPTNIDISLFGGRYAEAAYLPDHKKAAPEGFANITARDSYELMFKMLARALDGNLPAADGVRKLKPIKGPDAVMQAANAAFTVAVSHLAAADIPFPRFQKT